MIPVSRPTAPPYFDDLVGVPGAEWLATPTQTMPSLWNAVLLPLRSHYRCLCGYLGLHESVGSIDHFISKNSRPDLAFSWDNFLDPYEVGPGWFRIELPSLHMVATDAIPATVRAKAEFTLRRLRLHDDPRAIESRLSIMGLYCSGDPTYDIGWLRAVAPLLAEAVVREGFMPVDCGTLPPPPVLTILRKKAFRRKP